MVNEYTSERRRTSKILGSQLLDSAARGEPQHFFRGVLESESESEMFLFDPYQKYIQSNNETILDQGTPIKTSLVANIRAAYYIINNYLFISQLS